MKKLLFVLCLESIVLPCLADEVRRDANGKIISTTSKTPTGTQIVRDPNGKVIETKSPQGGTTEAAAHGTGGSRRTGESIVRDANGKIIRSETKK